MLLAQQCFAKKSVPPLGNRLYFVSRFFKLTHFKTCILFPAWSCIFMTQQNLSHSPVYVCFSKSWRIDGSTQAVKRTSSSLLWSQSSTFQIRRESVWNQHSHIQLFVETKSLRYLTFTFKICIVFILNLKYLNTHKGKALLKIICNKIAWVPVTSSYHRPMFAYCRWSHVLYCSFHKTGLNKKAELSVLIVKLPSLAGFFSEIRGRVISLRHKNM